jgi:hypothetical protein
VWCVMEKDGSFPCRKLIEGRRRLREGADVVLMPVDEFGMEGPPLVSDNGDSFGPVGINAFSFPYSSIQPHAAHSV